MMEEPNNNCAKFLRKYFPFIWENVYGGIPMIGLSVSLYTSALLTQVYVNIWREPAWGIPFIMFSLLVFAGVQTFWGFQAKKLDIFKLWLICKGIEVVFALLIILYSAVGGPFSYMFLFPAIFDLVITLGILHVGFSKYRFGKKIKEKNILADAESQQIKVNV